MNEENGTTQLASTPVSPPAAREGVLSLDISQIQRMHATDLKHLRSTLNALIEVGYGLSSQPRFHNGAKCTAAGLFMNELSDLISNAHDAVYNAAKQMKVRTTQEVEDRAWVLIGAKADWEDDLTELSVLVSSAVCDHSYADFRERSTVFASRGVAQ